MAILTVGLGQQYATIAAAVAATKDGDVVNVLAGTYTNDFAIIAHKITLQGVGGVVNMVATVAPPNGKAILVVDADTTIDHFAFSGTKVRDGNGAGIRYEAGNLVIKNSLFKNNQNGLLGGPNATGTILIQNSEFDHNGSGTGSTHNIYVGAIKSLVIQDSYFHDAVVGHEIKSRALSTTITGSRIQDNATGTASYSIDLPNGGVGLIQGNVIEKGPLSQNGATIHYGGEVAAPSGSSLMVTGNTIITDKANATLLLNHTPLTNTPVTAVITGNSTYGYATTRIASGPATVTNETLLGTRPTLDTTPLVTAATVPQPGTSIGPAMEYGRAGAVIASGRVLTVGAGQQYATLARAVAASQDGDTIQVKAGTYVNDFAEATHKVIIEGVGGMAKFVATAQPANGKAQLVTNTDATLINMEFSGTAVPDRNGAAIRYQGGNLTLVNTFIHDNQEGLLAAAVEGGTIGIYDSEFSHNGIEGGNGGTHNIYVGKIGTLTVRNSYIHDTPVGHEVKSRADNTILDGNRIVQGTHNGSYDVDLPSGGKAVLTNNIIEKGAFAQNSASVHLGGEGVPYMGSSFTGTGNTFVNDRASAILLLNQGGAPATLTGNRTFNYGPTLVTGVGTATGTTVLGSAPSLVTAAGYNAAGIPVGDIGGGGGGGGGGVTPSQDTLVLHVSEDAYMGDARFSVLVDGVNLGTFTSTASHAAGQSQNLTIKGDFADPRSIRLSYVNDAQGTGAGRDRNLYLDGVSLNGTEMTGVQTKVTGATQFNTTGPLSTVTFKLSQDDVGGGAHVKIGMDGVVMTDMLTVSASHALGLSMNVSFLAPVADIGHTFTVTHYNDTAGPARNVYVDSIDIGATHLVPGLAVGTEVSSRYAIAALEQPPAAAAYDVQQGSVQPLIALLGH